MTICDLCFGQGRINEAPETCVECSADMCPVHGEGEFCSHCLREMALTESAAELCWTPDRSEPCNLGRFAPALVL